jgi:hypothetical protein
MAAPWQDLVSWIRSDGFDNGEAPPYLSMRIGLGIGLTMLKCDSQLTLPFWFGSTSTVSSGPNGVEVFAAGTRNPYGVYVHSNGKVYATGPFSLRDYLCYDMMICRWSLMVEKV